VEKFGRRFSWKDDLAAFDFPEGSLVLTEVGTKKQDSLHVLQGEDALCSLNPGGIGVLESDAATFAKILTRTNHTLKRALTDPQLFSGIGNAYSDETLFRARLSPAYLTQKLSQEQIQLLFEATRETLIEWIDRLRRETGLKFPEKVTAFRKDMAVHGRYRQPCHVCGSLIQRICYAANEASYCARCQTNGRLLADRAWSRLLRTTGQGHWINSSTA
jgi:formamidopyrimidine-DNA glycosylase